jgi:cell wall-associated NlpC family hydrolase
LAEIGIDAHSSRRERRLAEQKSMTTAPRTAALPRAVRTMGNTKSVKAIVEHRRGIVRIAVMTVAFGMVGTFALPAYAVTPGEHAVSVAEFQARLQQEAQTVSVTADAGKATAARDGYSTTAARVAAATTPGLTPGQAAGAPATRAPSVDVSGIKSNSGVLNTALALVGTPGDCTAFVEQTLRNMGYTVGDLGPMQFGGYGTVFTDPSQIQPGDIMMRGGHVAIYAGPGLAAEGGIGGMSYLTPIASDPNTYVEFVRVG